MIIKLISKPINEALGLCFNQGAYDLEVIKKINSGKEVEVNMIPSNAKRYVKQVIKKPVKKQAFKKPIKTRKNK